jgi:drug/metabolite transporter superfamily protein YnfA
VVAALAAGALAWLGISRFYGDIPDFTVVSGLTLAGLAVVEGVAAFNTWTRIQRHPRSGPLNPLLVARFAVLAKASSLGGALFAGVYAGVAIWAAVERDRLRVAEENLVPAIVGVVGALMLVGAALALERACRVPPRPPGEEDEETGDAAREEPR